MVRLLITVALCFPIYAFKPTLVVADLQNPVFVTTRAGTNSLFIVEQAGKIKEWDGKQLKTFLDISERVKSGGELGLLSVAFHPQFEKNGRFFVYYNRRASPIDNVISEFRVRRAEEKVLLAISKKFTNHNGGQLVFGPDGHLYMGTGDGGAAGDPDGNAQNLSELLGKILRISVEKSPFTIPEDNPFRGKHREMIFAYGLRNPWRFSFDRKTGLLWAADVGQNRLEEVNRIEKGMNYGWKVMEGSLCFSPSIDCNKEGKILPVVEYGRQQGDISITGGYVYRGRKIPELLGQYIFGDYVSGRIWSVPSDKVAAKQELIDTTFSISSFGEEADGEILIVDHAGGAVYRLER